MFLSLTALALTAPLAPAEVAAPRYYFVLFGGQSVPFRPRTAHTWATFVKATPTPGGAVALEQVTISWLPAEGPVQPLKLRAVPGKNYTLDETFAVAADNRDRVSMWGPFETDARRYELAAAQAGALASGAIRFRSLDSFGRNHAVMHCVHALTFADPNLQALRQPVLRVGEPGTSKLAARYVESGSVAGPVTHDWVLPALGLDRFAVVRRTPGERIPRQWR